MLYLVGFRREYSMKRIKFPKPTPDTKSYESTIQRGFQKYPERYENYLKYKNTGKLRELNYAPIKIDIENVSRCNLSCSMCQISKIKDRKRAKDLSIDDFKIIIDKLYGVFEIKIQGIGEPFLQADFFKMVEYASFKDIWVRTTTNATLLDRDEKYKRIIDAGIGEIQISIDGTTKDTYETIRINADFERMVQNCKLINNYCYSLEMDKTRMWVLLQRDNFHELHKFPAFAERLGFKRLTISMDISGWGDNVWTIENSDRNVSHEVLQDDIDRLLEESIRLGIDLTFWDITDKYTIKNICPWPFERAYISSDKFVVPCCMIGNPDKINFGNFNNFNFMDIWNGDEYKDFRESHINGNIPAICKYCYVIKREI